MRVHFTKRVDDDLISIRRDDGSHVEVAFPKKGQIPHDAIHLIVERHLGLHTAFWGRVAAGADPKEVGLIAKAGRHVSAARGNCDIVELVQAERLVQCFEADLSHDPTDVATFLGVLEAACAQSHVAIPTITAEQLQTIHTLLDSFRGQWQPLATGQRVRLDWA